MTKRKLPLSEDILKMSHCGDSDALTMLLPDLLTTEELVSKIQSRCRIKNLGLMSKEGLVGLFRRVILPLPQRFYRANRRGKMLTSRRAKTGLETRRTDEGCSIKDFSSKISASNNRLKLPPSKTTHSHRKKEEIRSEERSLDNIIIRDRRKLSEYENKEDKGRKESRISPCDFSAGKKVTLKRTSGEKNSASESTSPIKSKKRRNVIKWP